MCLYKIGVLTDQWVNVRYMLDRTKKTRQDDDDDNDDDDSVQYGDMVEVRSTDLYNE